MIADRVADETLRGGGGGGGGSGGAASKGGGKNKPWVHVGAGDETGCMPAHGGAGGGAIELVTETGDLWIGGATIIMDGAGSYMPGRGGAGAGGMVRLKARGGSSIVVA